MLMNLIGATVAYGAVKGTCNAMERYGKNGCATNRTTAFGDERGEFGGIHSAQYRSAQRRVQPF